MLLLFLSPASAFTLQKCHHLPVLWCWSWRALLPKAALVPPLTPITQVCCAWWDGAQSPPGPWGSKQVLRYRAQQHWGCSSLILLGCRAGIGLGWGKEKECCLRLSCMPQLKKKIPELSLDLASLTYSEEVLK